MKYFSKLILAGCIIALFASCDKVKDNTVYANGSAVTLSSSTASVAALPADSLNTVISFNWTNPGYATDSSNYKFILEIDSTGRNFSKAVSKTIMAAYTTSFTGKELNNILLGFGFKFNIAYDIDVRVISSYGNNNERYYSNVVKIRATPYKVPPKVTLPINAKLYLVGSASQGGWTNPVPVPTQEFAMLDSTTYSGVFNLNGGSEYLILPENGSWSNKYSVADNSVPGLSAGGDFGYNLNDNFPGPATSGMYQITLDFQAGKFTCKPYNGPSLPNNLYIVGDATPGGWTNPVPVPSQQLTRKNSVQFEITLPITGGNQYLLLPVNGSWSNKYSVPNNTLPGLADGGYFGYNYNDNFPAPALSGNYKLEVNFAVADPANPINTAKFKMTKL
jgi:hypothetical protein